MYLPTFRKVLAILLMTTISLLPFWASTSQSIRVLQPAVFITDFVKNRLRETFMNGECDDVLSQMMRGYWKTRNLTKKENDDITAFLTHSQTRYRFPKNYQRADGLCGNITFPGSGIARWFRALCDPRGATPCCYHNQCAMKSVEECVCEDCYDMRHMKHAEYSTWIPSHPACPYKEHTPQEACDILNGINITFFGDSLVRHVYTAMLLVVTGNIRDGALSKTATKAGREACIGMYMFTEDVCRKLLKPNLRGCNGSVYLKVAYNHRVDSLPAFKREMSNRKEKTLIFTGIGIHESFKYERVQTMFWLPALTHWKMENHTWPKAIWAASHAPGLLKSPTVVSQLTKSVKLFNEKMETFLRSWKIPIFDTFNLTDGMMSFDGEHYGRGMNIVKANILLSYIREMRSKEKW